MKINTVCDRIRRPVITEKSNRIEKQGKYSFIISRTSNKTQIKDAIEEIFKIEVKSVNIMNIYGKQKIFKGRKGVRASLKKAIVTTKNMKKIEFSKGL